MPQFGPRRRVKYRREREGKTDYSYRIELLRSGKPRLIGRISLRHVRAHMTSTGERGDETLASAFSKELSEWGWKGYTANIPAAYLVGLLCGFRAMESGIGEGVLDIDNYVPSPQAKIFAVLRGSLDAGLDIPHGEEVLPSEDRCRGVHISEYAQKLKSNKERYQSQFSNYLEKGLNPEDLPEHFMQVKEKIIAQYGE